MKLLYILYVLLIVVVAKSLAQRGRPGQRCAGRPRNPSCTGPRNVGRGGLRCGGGNMFYYDADTRQCRQMRYRGCGGNNNRWCSRAQCQRSCIR